MKSYLLTMPDRMKKDIVKCSRIKGVSQKKFIITALSISISAIIENENRDKTKETKRRNNNG